MHPTFAATGGNAVPIWFVTSQTWPKIRDGLAADARSYADAADFQPKPGRHLVLPGDKGPGGVLFGLEAEDDRKKDPFLTGKLADALPGGTYRFGNAPHDARLAALGFALGTYRFSRYRKPEAKEIKLTVPDGVDAADISRTVEGVMSIRLRTTWGRRSSNVLPASLRRGTGRRQAPSSGTNC
jgi:leucyl aminopeptidase